MNVGVAIWHPRFGGRFPTSGDLRRIACLDRGADLHRVKRDLDAIRDIVIGWTDRDNSPLTTLASQFRFDLVVSEPLRARVTDIEFLSESLSRSLLAPDRPTRQQAGDTILDKRFRKGFSAFAKEALANLGILGGDFNISERRGVEPIKIAARFRHQGDMFVWRTLTYAKTDRPTIRKTKAQAIDAENDLLRSLSPYGSARLNIAVRLPEDGGDIERNGIRHWLERHANRIVTFRRAPTMQEADPNLLLAS
jgi:hypothetical protein